MKPTLVFRSQPTDPPLDPLVETSGTKRASEPRLDMKPRVIKVGTLGLVLTGANSFLFRHILSFFPF